MAGLLDAISPDVYADIGDLDLEPGTYISVIGKRRILPTGSRSRRESNRLQMI